MLEHSKLLEHLHYHPETGVWTLLIATKFREAGGRADSVRAKKYRGLFIEGVQYYSHILAWFYMTGAWPSRDIDHENTNSSDNRWKNLRLATASQNGANARLNKTNTSGHKGVTWDKARSRWRAQIKIQWKMIYLGRFKEKALAIKARKQAAIQAHGKFARHA